MNVAEFIVDFLSKKGVDTVFMIPGGQAMFLNDAVYKNKKITPIFTHHEQAAGMAAEAFGRTKGEIGVAMVTAGPGAINVLNGVVGAWVDSAPMIVIAGQSALPNVQYMEKTHIRQLGLQGIYMEPLMKSVVKYFVTVDDASKILYYLEKAYHAATTGRKGPVCIEVPLDVQRFEVPKKLLKIFEAPIEREDMELLKEQVKKTISFLKTSKRPLIVAGQGVELSRSEKIFTQLINKIKVPVVTSRLAIDVIDSGDELFVGRPGLYADRAANIAVQNADLIISLGARLDSGITGYDAKDWGRNAKKIVVDIDPKELAKPGIDISFKIQNDVKLFIEELILQLKNEKLKQNSEWIDICGAWKKKYPTVLSSYKKENPVNSYYLIERLSIAAKNTDTILVDTSSPFHVACQAWKIKIGQRFLTTGGISTMGYWVAGIGACMARNKGRTIIITGDGCLQMNIQEFATIKQNNLPIKVIIFNNNGYLLIRHTQKTHFGNLRGESPKTGLGFPDFMQIAKAYGIKGIRIKSVAELDRKLKETLEYKGPVICEVMTPEWQALGPRVSSQKNKDGSMVSKPYEDLAPFLTKEELDSNMIAENKD